MKPAYRHQRHGRLNAQHAAGAKRCTKCNEVLPLSDFSVRNASPDGLSYKCRPCGRRDNAENYKRTADKAKARAAQWADGNRERRREIVQAYDSRNRDQKRAASRRHTKAVNDALPVDERREKWRREAAIFRERNPERATQIAADARKRRRLVSPDKVRLEKAQSSSVRRARKRNAAIGTVDFSEILKRDGAVCHICSQAIPDGDLEFDHVIALSKGGAHSMENIKPAHSRCNRSKGAK